MRRASKVVRMRASVTVMASGGPSREWLYEMDGSSCAMRSRMRAGASAPSVACRARTAAWARSMRSSGKRGRRMPNFGTHTVQRSSVCALSTDWMRCVECVSNGWSHLARCEEIGPELQLE